jgi:Leucine-rich repeat (LRR) protein
MLLLSSEKLLLHEMNLKGTIPERIFERVTRLTEITLYENELSGQIPTTIGLLKDVQKFLLGNNKFGGSLPRHMGLMVDLRTFNVSGNSIGGSIPDLIQALKDLKELGLARNGITGMKKLRFAALYYFDAIMTNDSLRF